MWVLGVGGFRGFRGRGGFAGGLGLGVWGGGGLGADVCD